MDSTTPDKSASKATPKNQNKNQNKKARISAAKKRAKTILSLPGYISDSTNSEADEVDRLRKQVLVLEKELKKKNGTCVGNYWHFSGA